MTTYTASPTETLRLGDVVVMCGEIYDVVKCDCCGRFYLEDSCCADCMDWQHLDLPRLTELVRQEFAKLAPREQQKEVPPLAVGQKWRTRGGAIGKVIKGYEDDGDSFRVEGSPFWYDSHRNSKSCHAPGMGLSDDNIHTLVELISDATAPEKSPDKDEVTLVLSKEEAQFMLQVTGQHVFGGGPARGHSDAIYFNLLRQGLEIINREDYPISNSKSEIRFEEIKEPLFKINEVWRTEKKYLVRVIRVRANGTADVRTIHNPKDAEVNFGHDGTREVSADWTIAGWNDKLVEKISD